ncbi:MAG: glycosyltransferase family 2 protein [Blastocatellales bacterium]
MTVAGGHPHISVVVPVYNGEKTIVQTVECLLRQSLKPDEIIVVDDGSTDGTREALRKFDQRITLLTQANSGPASARNRGVKAAKYAFVAFTDSDCLPDEDWLLNLLRGFDNERVAGAGGSVRSAIRGLTGEYVDAVRLLDPQPDEAGEIPYLITANACFRRDALIEAGLFNERFRKPGGEEPDLCFRIRRLGYEFRFVEQALVHHHHRQTIKSFLNTIANYGEGLYVLGRLWPDYSIESPLMRLIRKSVALRSIIQRIPGYAAKYGLSRAVYFSLLDYLRQVALLSGYLRGKRREA